MFTGIVSAVGRIVSVTALGPGAQHGRRLALRTPPGWLDDVRPGDSIALDGACMTVAALDRAGARFEVDVSAESLARTAGLDRERGVNLEKALAAGERLGGHLVSGHVDGIGRVEALEPVGESHRLVVVAPAALARFLAYKGSVAVNGVSLTVNRVDDDATGAGCRIDINLVPHTLAHTTLGGLAPGASVNLEIDLIARYVERMLGASGDGPLSRA